MSLPFLKYNKQNTGVIVQHTGETPEGVKAASDLIKAVESKDESAAYEAFKRMFKACEDQPNEDAPDSTEETK